MRAPLLSLLSLAAFSNGTELMMDPPCSAGEAQKELDEVKDAMSESFVEIKQSLGSVASAVEMREELKDVKEGASSSSSLPPLPAQGHI